MNTWPEILRRIHERTPLQHEYQLPVIDLLLTKRAARSFPRTKVNIGIEFLSTAIHHPPRIAIV